jgi:2-dehydro-3-deoxyphosphogluconate aldolase/(4S)-4-hydroxy-2-oxoglutarate aldolase
MISENMKTIFDIGLVPLVVLDDAADAVPFGRALAAGGIPVAEVTFRTEACLDIIRAMSEQVEGLIVGAGTVHTVQQAADAVAAGATFIVTPAFNPAVTEWCVKKHVDIIPGTVSPADIEAANGFGIEVCKFFPAAAYGGIQTLKALAGPFGHMKFLPTGGINYDNMNEYLDLPNVAAVGGSFMTPSQMVKDKDWAGIEKACKNAVRHLFDFSLGHIGLHAQDRTEAEMITEGLCGLLLQDKIPGSDNFFAGTIAEICDHPMPGEKGHICIDTRDIPRALAYYKRHGVEVNEDLCFRDDKGDIKVFFLKAIVGGFSIHLRRRAK